MEKNEFLTIPSIGMNKSYTSESYSFFVSVSVFSQENDFFGISGYPFSKNSIIPSIIALLLPALMILYFPDTTSGRAPALVTKRGVPSEHISAAAKPKPSASDGITQRSTMLI